MDDYLNYKSSSIDSYIFFPFEFKHTDVQQGIVDRGFEVMYIYSQQPFPLVVPTPSSSSSLNYRGGQTGTSVITINGMNSRNVVAL